MTFHHPLSPSRRRVISVLAAVPLIGLAARLSKAAPQPVRWRGTAMGADASIDLYHPDPAWAHGLIGQCVAEIRRVEGIFSLFRRDSALVRLNRDGQLSAPPDDMVALAMRAMALSRLSQGAFDVTVQPLWALYRSHFAQAQPDPAGPAADRIAAARAKVAWQDLVVEKDRLSFARPGMAATFNALAQGYVTDRVAAILMAAGITDMMLDLGELRGLGGHEDGRPWRVGIADPADPARMIDYAMLRDQAAATSGGYGTRFDGGSMAHHLFDPATGRPAQSWAGVTVFAPDALTADGLSTTLAVSSPVQAADLLRQGGGSAAILVDDAGQITRLDGDVRHQA